MSQALCVLSLQQSKPGVDNPFLMCLLRILAEDRFSLVDYVEHLPPYTILLHTWEHDHEEVIFRDLEESVSKDKPGFREFSFCARRADNDGLRLF
jgi:hypothetical protein